MDTVLEQPRALPAKGYYHRLLTGCGVLAALMFALMGGLVCTDIFLRNLTSLSMPWTVEVCEYLLMTATLVAAPWLLYQEGHIRIDILLRALSPEWRSWADRLISALGLLICVLLTWFAVDVALDKAQQGSLVFKVLVFPEWWLNLPMIFGFGLMTLEFARRLLPLRSVEEEVE
ncbi:hypothetical protein GCM10009104_27130 [Marinobacterium maritimum]|uniref:TRAP transporter small permease protein n=1 Tax=Marinobacterium maritimum TaxID=500162 RepID=A0ABP3TF94_9GAMM